MGQINLIHDESYRAARLVVNLFQDRLNDDELVESFHIVHEKLTEAMNRVWERHERELHRLAKLKSNNHE